MEHLNDKIMQSLISGEAELTAESQAHLKTCAQCRSQLEAYQALYRELSQPLPSKLPIHFARQTARLAIQKKPQPHLRLSWEIVLAASGLGLALTAAIIFMDFSAVIQILPGLAQPLKWIQTAFIIPAHKLLNQWSPKAILLPAAGLIIFFFGSLDAFLVKRKRQLFH